MRALILIALAVCTACSHAYPAWTADRCIQHCDTIQKEPRAVAVVFGDDCRCFVPLTSTLSGVGSGWTNSPQKETK